MILDVDWQTTSFNYKLWPIMKIYLFSWSAFCVGTSSEWERDPSENGAISLLDHSHAILGTRINNGHTHTLMSQRLLLWHERSNSIRRALKHSGNERRRKNDTLPGENCALPTKKKFLRTRRKGQKKVAYLSLKAAAAAHWPSGKVGG